jgi:hypothetical protein
MTYQIQSQYFKQKLNSMNCYIQWLVSPRLEVIQKMAISTLDQRCQAIHIHGYQ